MFSYTAHVDVLTEPEEAFKTVADLMLRGHYFPDSVRGIRETAPRPPSETDMFLPGQRIAYLVNGVHHEQMIAEAEEFYESEATIVERPVRPLKGECIEWRLSELMPGTIRITLTFQANYNMIEKVHKGGEIKKFWGETLKRVKSYLEDKRTYSEPDTYAPQPASSDPLN